MNIADIEGHETWLAERGSAIEPNDVIIVGKVNLGGPVSDTPPF